METPPGEVTILLHQVRNGNRSAQDRLISLVYQELRRIAARYLRNEAPQHSLQPTALVHEAYLRLTGMEQMDWQSRAHFFGVAAKLMRNILVDHARARNAAKRGDGYTLVGLDDVFLASPDRVPAVLALDEALDRLASVDPRQSRIVELRFFSGLTDEETGHLLGISSRTVKRDWRLAKAWLFLQLSPQSASLGTPNPHETSHEKRLAK
jgi:RNA polymerase sigma factor (TIGR02999 family)